MFLWFVRSYSRVMQVWDLVQWTTKFRNRLKGVRPDLTVINTSVDNIPVDCDVAVVQETLVERAKKSAPFAENSYNIKLLGRSSFR